MEGFISVLANQSPIVVLMCVIGYYMYKHFKDQTKILVEAVMSKDVEIKELNQQARLDGLDSLKLLTEMSHLMEGIINKQSESTTIINESIKNEALGIKTHVDNICDNKKAIN